MTISPINMLKCLPHPILIFQALLCFSQNPSLLKVSPADDLHQRWFRPVPEAVVGNFTGQLVVSVCVDGGGRVLSATIKEEVKRPRPILKIITDETSRMMKGVEQEAPAIPASQALRDTLLAIVNHTTLRPAAMAKRCEEIIFEYSSRTQSAPIFHFAHTSRLGCMRYSPDGALLATSGTEGCSIKLWDTQTGRLLQTLKGYGLGGVVFRFSPDGKYLAALYAEGRIQFWKVFKTYASEHNYLELDFGEGTSFVFSHDGSRLAYNRSQSVEILDLETWEVAFTIPFEQKNYTRHIAWHPGGHSLGIALEDRILVRDIKSGQVVKEYPNSQELKYHIRADIFFSNDGNILYNVMERGGWVEAYNLATDSTPQRFQLLDENENAYSLPDAAKERIGFSRFSGGLLVFDLQDGQLLQQFPNAGKTEQILFDFHPAGKQVAREYEDFGFQLLDGASGNTIAITEGAELGVLDLAFHPQKPLLAVANKDGTVALWNTDSIIVERILPTHNGWVTSLCFSPDGDFLATAGRDSTAKLWELETGKLLHQFRQHKGPVNKIIFTPDGHCLATGGQDRSIWLHAFTDEGIQSRQLGAEKQAVYALAFSPDGQWLASSSMGQEVKMWNLTRNKKPVVIDKNAGWSMALSFSDDGKYLLYGKNRGIVVWDITRNMPLDTINTHESIVTDASWLRDKDEMGILSVGLDDRRNGWVLNKRFENQGIPMIHTGGTTAIAISPGNKWIATGDGDNNVYLEYTVEPTESWGLNCLGTTGKWLARKQWSSGVFHCSQNMMERLH